MRPIRLPRREPRQERCEWTLSGATQKGVAALLARHWLAHIDREHLPVCDLRFAQALRVQICDY